jgi:L-amino acid N-acyltransferase YncA
MRRQPTARRPRNVSCPNLSPEIRLATTADLPAIVAIYNATIPTRRSTADLEPVSVVSRRPWLARHDPQTRPCWVLDEAGAVVAWLSLENYKDRAAYSITAEVSVYVDVGARRKGHARALLLHAINHAPALDPERLLAVIFGHNEASISLFERSGFERWGVLPGVTRLDGVAADIVILGRAVGPQRVTPTPP